MCPELPAIQYLQYSDYNTAFGNIINITCDPGYAVVLKDSDRIRIDGVVIECERDGSWSLDPRDAKCESK